MKIGIYIRVSTEEQKIKGISIDDQKLRGIEFCETGGHTYEIFNDAGFSGSLPPEERPSLNRMLEQIYLEEIGGIYVVDFDRITRDEKFGFVLKKMLIDNKIKLFDSSGEINLLDETQDLLLGIKILLSSFELKRLRVRIKRNLLRSVKEGNVGGGPMLNYGFKKGENKKLVIDEVEAEVVKLIFQLSIEGKGTKVIANFLNDQDIPTKRMTSLKGHLKVKGENKVKFLWRDAVIHRILTNTIYKGMRLYKGEYYELDSYIIEPAKFDLVQIMMKQRNIFKDTTNKHFYLLKGLIICGECKSRFYGVKKVDSEGLIKNSENHYTCSSQRHRKEWCGTKGINIDYLDNLVLKEVNTLESDVNNFFEWYEDQKMVRVAMMELAQCRKRELQIIEKQENLVEIGMSGNIPTDMFNTKIEGLNKMLEKVLKDKFRYIKELNLLDKKENILRVVKEHINTLNDVKISNDIKRDILRSLVEKIYIQWNKDLMIHTLIIDYKIDHLTQYRIGKNIDLTYKQAGFRVKQDIFTHNLFVRKMIVGNEDKSHYDAIGMPMVTIS